MKNRKLLFLPVIIGHIFAVSLLHSQPLIKDAEIRQSILWNTGWHYLEQPLQEYAEMEKQTSGWTAVQLPHTWNAWDAVDTIPGYRKSISWYTKQLVLPKISTGLRVSLAFEGVNMKSEVYVNGLRAGGHTGGYIPFDIDITPFVLEGKNLIAVKADNTEDPDIIPSQKSDFILYGGICRNVRITVVPSVSISRLKIRTPSVTRELAGAEATIVVRNPSLKKMAVTFEGLIKNKKGKPVAMSQGSFMLDGELTEGFALFPEIKDPELWSPSSPSMYTMTMTLKANGKVVDEFSEKFGYRWFEFKEGGPFYLNGQRLLLRGTHRHEDWAGLGNALSDSLQYADVKMIKEMGANFIRLGHYPQAPVVYKACDELGLLVWDELPWCRGGVGGKTWEQNTLPLLEEMISLNFNHPSIIIWSLANEVEWNPPDFPDGNKVDTLRRFLSILNARAHELDSSRVTATRRFDDGADIVDIHSSSIWMGWYSSSKGYNNYQKAIDEARKKFKRFFHAEYGGDSHVGRHTETPVGPDGSLNGTSYLPADKKGDWSESYIVNLFDWHLGVSEQSELLTGSAQWIFRDFATPLRPENPIPFVNQKGLTDRSGKPKDAYYVYKSYWTTDPKFCYIESHTWTERTGLPGELRQVKVFSNCNEVELFVNGKSLGKKTRDIRNFPAAGLRWDVSFKAGNNSIKAVGYDNSKKITSDEIAVSYSLKKSGKPEKLVLSVLKNKSGTVTLTASVIDNAGNRCLEYNKRILFSLSGDGELFEFYGTPGRSSLIEMANGNASIEFIKKKKGSVILTARSERLSASIEYK